MELVGVFCTYLGAPNRHIAKKTKNPKNYRTFTENFDSAYLLPIFPVWSQPMGAHGTCGLGPQGRSIGNSDTMRPYPLAPLSVGSAGKIEDRGSEKSGKKSSQNWACLVWKFLVELVRVFCTYLGAPNRHIAKNPKKTFFYRKFIQHFDSAY